MTDTLAARVSAVRDHLDTAWATPVEPEDQTGAAIWAAAVAGPDRALRDALSGLIDLVAELAAKVEAG